MLRKRSLMPWPYPLIFQLNLCIVLKAFLKVMQTLNALKMAAFERILPVVKIPRRCKTVEKFVLPKEFKYLFLYLIAITAVNLPHNTVVQIKQFFGFL